MARPRKDATIDLGAAHELTAALIERLPCPAAGQAFLRDSKAPGLRVRATPPTAKSVRAARAAGRDPEGCKAFVFEAKLNRQTIRRTIGDVRHWDLDKARTEARRLAVLLDNGQDPRELERQQQAERDARAAAAVAQAADAERAAVTVGEVWAAYLQARRSQWGEAHYNDHIKLARAGGVPVKRGKGLTIAMPLHPLMALRLCDLDAPTIEAWAATQAASRPTSARLAWRLLKVFLNWCAEQPEYAPLLPAKNAAATRKARETLGRPQVKTDSLMREQLPAWFAAVRDLTNPTIAAALQVMLLTGARPGEVLAMRWEDVNTKWKGLTIRDKVEGERVIPLTPYVSHLLAGLPRRNEWIFASTRAVSMDEKNIRRRERRAHAKGETPAIGDVLQASESGRITEPRSPHVSACKVAGIEGLSLHGLRRSFKSLTEWLEIPAGVVAQLMGHKPSATAERHYTVRPLDLLRVHHEKIEAWILKEAGIEFDAKAEPAALRVVTAV